MSLLGLNVVFDVLLSVFDIRVLLTDPTAGGYDPAVFGPLDLDLTYSIAFTLYVATGIVFIVWFHRLRRNAGVWAGDLQSRGPGWAIGGWFIPIGNLWIPRGIAVDIWRASRLAPYAADGKSELTLLNSWWGFWVAGTVVDRIAARLYSNAYTADAYVTAASWSFVGYALDIAAAVLAIRFVPRLTSMQHAKATGVLPAAR
ncbi:DUF4328 domain-containing protein [Streptomyces sp. NPDC046712]|uniref:DUF4328 domain-containing protein n=1 Tax=Streptomyces sp. NPDC046712 TaxID=3154802 RepID=UPI0033FF2872